MASNSLKLTRLGKDASKKDYQERINLLNAKIESGKLTPDMRKRATDYRWMAEQKLASFKNGSVKPTKKTSLKSAKNFNVNQMSLPGFLKTLNFVRIEELIANRIADDMKSTKKVSKKIIKKTTKKSSKAA